MLEMTLNKSKNLDSKLQDQTMKERQIWKKILTHLLNVKFLTKGRREDVYSSKKDNFIELVEQMSKSDSVLGKHYLKEVNDNWRYLLSKI